MDQIRDSYSLSDNISLVTVTHYSPRENYGELAPPSLGIIKTTINSFHENVPGLQECDHHIVYNRPIAKDNKEANKYQQNLSDFCKTNQNFNFLHRPNSGLRPALADVLEKVKTPLVLFVEHDWELLKKIDIDGIIDTFSQYEEVNSIRLNKRPNETSLWDTIVQEDMSKPIPLCRVSSVGNHPQITRTSVMRRWIEKSNPTLYLILKGFWYHYSTPQSAINYMSTLYDKYIRKKNVVGKFDNVEFVLDTKYKSQIREQGFDTAHSNWGIYLYGANDEGPFVQHLGR